jgi:hypothetical protein
VDRRLLHKLAIVGGGLVLIGGAVVVLRNPDSGKRSDVATVPPVQTTVQSYADKSVVVPQPGVRPKSPERLDIRATEHRIVAGWGPRRIGKPEPDGAVGYEVRWGTGGRLDHVRYVAEPVIQLDGLDNDTTYTVQVRTVDSFGQRSEPVSGTGVPSPENIQDPTVYSFVDRFDGPVVPDPARWRLVAIGNCTKASRGSGEDARRMVITGQCGGSNETVGLRSRTPLELRANPADGELGRFVVQTDRPGQGGELLLDLVPGPVDLIGKSQAENTAPAGDPGQATVDSSLPPGTIRVRISGREKETAARVQVAPGTPLLGKKTAVHTPALPEIGVSVRWEVVLRTDGVQVLEDGQLVAAGDVVPSFTEATALVGFDGGPTGLRAAVDLIGFAGAPTQSPPLVPAPLVDFERNALAPDRPAQTTPAGTPTRARTGQLRVTLVPQRDLTPDSQFTVEVAGKRIPLRPSVAGQVGRAGVRLPTVADVPPDALLLTPGGDFIRIAVRAGAAEDGFPTQVLTAEFEFTGDPPARSASADNPPLPRSNAELASPRTTLLDAAGQPIPSMADVPRGRLILDLSMDAAAAERVSGAVAGLAGVELTLDGKPLAGISTVTDGPGIGGNWRIALNNVEIASGAHTIQILAIGVDATTANTFNYVSFTVRQ